MRSDPPALGQPPDGSPERGPRRDKTGKQRATRDMAESGREPTAPHRLQTSSDNLPVVSVEALRKLADWLEGWKRRNPEAWERIPQRRAEAGTEATGVEPRDPPPQATL